MTRLAAAGLLVPAVLAEAAAALLTLVPEACGPTLLVAGAVLALLVGVPVVRRRRVPVRGLAAVGAVAAIALAVLLRLPSREPPVPLAEDVAATVRVDAVRVSSTNDHAGALTARLVVTATLLEVRTAHARIPASAPILLFADRLPAAGRVPGARLEGTVRLQGADRTDTVAFTAGARRSLRLVEPAPPVQRLAAALRSGLTRRSASLPGDGGALLPGLAIGDTDRVPEALDLAMKQTSLSHLTAVSGANCAVVTGAVLALAGLLRLPRSARIALALAALAAFVLLVTPQPSVQRAAVMAAVALVSLATGRTAGGTPVLALAVLGLLLTDPWLAREAGFVLSALATGGLLLLTRPIAQRLERLLPRPLALAVAVPVAAQVACEPVLVLLQPAVPLAGVLANLLAEPAAAAATVLGLLACVLLPLVSPLGSALALLAWLPAAWIAGVARAAAGLPSIGWPAGAVGAVLAVAGVVAVLVAAARRVPVAVRAVAAGCAALLGIAVVGAAVGSGTARLVGMPADWEIAACDVGQGDGLVLNGGGGAFAVVDTGRRPQPLADCLARLHVGRIALLVLTHFDADHVGAARSLAGRVGTVFVGPSDGPAADELRGALTAGGARVQQVHRGERTRVGRLLLDVLWPPDPLGDVATGNPASITLLATGRLRSLFTGDLGEDAQNALLAAGPLPRADVVKVAHHGSADQSPAFYADTGATLGLISCGLHNDYHHPTARLLRILRTDGIQPVRTDQDGLVLVVPDGGGARVWTERPITAAVWTPAR